METRYVAEFRISELTGETTQEIKEPKKGSQVVSKQPIFEAKNIAKGITTVVGVTALTAGIYTKLQATSNTITGDAVAQRQLDNRMALLNEGLGVFGALGVGALLGGPVGAGLAVGGIITNYAKRAFDVSQSNRVYQANQEISRTVQSQKQARLVKDKVGVRV